MKSDKKPDVALVVIAKNEERCIQRCLMSAKPYVNRMVVLDTGSTDKTVEIAKMCGAEVHHMQWMDDFAVARNRALDLANADWNLIMDADEWLKTGGGFLSKLESNNLFIGVLLVSSTFNQENSSLQTNNSHISRLLPRGVRYSGRIHEQPISDLNRLKIPLIFEHDGYEERHHFHKTGRNLSLLKISFEESPNDPYILYQIGKEYEGLKDFQQACDFYEKARSLIPHHVAYAHDLTVRLLHCLGQVGSLATAVVVADHEMAHWQHSPDFFFVIGNIFLDCAISEPEQAYNQWLPMAESAWLRCLLIGEQTHLAGSVTGRGSFLAAQNLAVIYKETGNTEKHIYYKNLATESEKKIYDPENSSLHLDW